MSYNKFGAKRVTLGGITFDSKAEAKRYSELKLLERAGEITSLRVHHRYPLKVDGTLVCTYECDFDYRSKSGTLVIEDVKGVITPVYRIKKKLFEAIYRGLTITEIRK